MNNIYSPSNEMHGDALTWREQEILILLADRMTNREIADQLHLAESTVKDYVGKILSKLQVRNRRQAVEQARALGLLDDIQTSVPNTLTNLPSETTPFVGRENELVEIKRLVRKARLLTLTGHGGIGKTRLALKAAEEVEDDFKDGSTFVSLAPIRSVAQIVQTIAEAVRFPLATNENPRNQLLRYLQKRQLLLVMDNFEHLLDGAGVVSEILQSAPRVKILATSRERLNLHSETIFKVGGMSFPDQADSMDTSNYDAVILFVQSARKIRLDFDPTNEELKQIANICHIVQGIPLGIELAAAWLHILSVDEIAEELDRGFDILSSEARDAPERHRSMRAVFDHSWSLMDQSEKKIFKRLSVFRGGFRREAAEQVAGASLDLLAGLANKSLLSHDPTSGRFEIHELLRQYAQEQLEKTPQTSSSAYEAHASFFAQMMKTRWEHLRGEKQILALGELEADLDNVRAAWQFHIEQADPSQLEKYIYSFWLLYWIRGWNHAAEELFRKLSAALGDIQGDEEVKAVSATAKAFQGFFLLWLGLADQGYSLANESQQILQGLNDPTGLFFANHSLSLATYYLNLIPEEKQATDSMREIALELDDQWLIALALCLSGLASFRSEDFEKAGQLAGASLRISDEIKDLVVANISLTTLGHIDVVRGKYSEAKKHYQRCLNISREIGFRWAIGNSTKYLGQVALLEGDTSEAEMFFTRSLKIADDLGLDRDIANHLYEFARLRLAEGRRAESVELLALLLQQPASQQARFGRRRIRDSAEGLLTQMEGELPPDVYSAAIERGQDLDLEGVILELIRSKSLRES